MLPRPVRTHCLQIQKAGALSPELMAHVATELPGCEHLVIMLECIQALPHYMVPGNDNMAPTQQVYARLWTTAIQKTMCIHSQLVDHRQVYNRRIHSQSITASHLINKQYHVYLGIPFLYRVHIRTLVSRPSCLFARSSTQTGHQFNSRTNGHSHSYTNIPATITCMKYKFRFDMHSQRLILCT